ncbi:hypothetical protein EAF00_008798 [Botryotinia globosa]|nr:hypothetical protein EAF00_008798 [Botryotinia globosa]
MGNNKNRRKNSNSGGRANDSSPTRNNNQGGKKGKGRNNNSENEGNPNKGRVPQEFLECRICEGKFHWESDCRKNPAGEGKRGKNSPECRECGGNHWEDQCRTWKSKNGGNAKKDSNKGRGPGDSNSSSSSDSDAGECLAPTGEDITPFFPNGQYPSRPCRKCQESGHWNNACEKDGFHPISNPNPGAARARKVGFQDGQSRGQVDSAYNQHLSPPGTQVGTWSTSESPPVNFGHAQQRSDTAMEYEYADPQYSYPQKQNQNQNQNSIREHINPNTDTPDYHPQPTHPAPYLTHAETPNPDHPDHPDSCFYQARYRSSICTLCHASAHKSHDCLTYRWLLPRTHSEWRPHPNLQHPSNALYPRPNGYWKGDGMKIPSRNTYIWPHPENVQQGRYWGENEWEASGKDVWIGEDDREGEGGRWRMAPGGCGGEESGGMCRVDGLGDVAMVDILDWEVRRWRVRQAREMREREREREREKGGWRW